MVTSFTDIKKLYGLRQVVFTLFPGCEKVKTTWQLVTNLIGISGKIVTKLTTQGCNNISYTLYHDCLYQSCRENLVTSLIVPSNLLQVVNSLFQTSWNKATSSANTTCQQIVTTLASKCEIVTCTQQTFNCPPKYFSDISSPSRFQFSKTEQRRRLSEDEKCNEHYNVSCSKQRQET